MNDNIFISVVLPVYSALYLSEAIESILNQSYKNFELIIINDGSPDNSLEIMNKFAKQDKRIIILNNKNKGLIYSLNEGIKISKGRFIARMDHDDISTVSRLERQVDFLHNNVDIDVVGTYIEEIDEYGNLLKGVVKYPITHEECLEFFKKRSPFAHPSVMFRREYFYKAGLYSFDLEHEEDTLLWYKGFTSGCHFSNIPFIGLKYRRTKDFYSRRSNFKKSLGLLKYRLFRINRELNYNALSDIYAILYFSLMMSPPFIKKIMYKIFR